MNIVAYIFEEAECDKCVGLTARRLNPEVAPAAQFGTTGKAGR